MTQSLLKTHDFNFNVELNVNVAQQTRWQLIKTHKNNKMSRRASNSLFGESDILTSDSDNNESRYLLILLLLRMFRSNFVSDLIWLQKPLETHPFARK